MAYALKKDGTGWRSVDSKKDIDKNTETFQEEQPDVIQAPKEESDD